MKPTKFDKNISIVIKAIRHMRKAKLLPIANSLCIDETNLSRLESGKRLWSPGRLRDMAKLLNVSLAELMLMAEFLVLEDFQSNDNEQLVTNYKHFLGRNNFISKLSENEKFDLVTAIKAIF